MHNNALAIIYVHNVYTYTYIRVCCNMVPTGHFTVVMLRLYVRQAGIVYNNNNIYGRVHNTKSYNNIMYVL